ncbi:hypothetical protein ElyMa_000722000 [Elysia marginata]|uniref:Uncharacterized protein n=1 Tax=Elysia marginata TaxID=1093978 RepID=A0AAV4GM11_9GAST|nr:hypothetical protein ElyMa_000722000 [Elysia marginata]
MEEDLTSNFRGRRREKGRKLGTYLVTCGQGPQRAAVRVCECASARAADNPRSRTKQLKRNKLISKPFFDEDKRELNKKYVL